MKTAKENLMNVLEGKKILFLENDNGLYHGLERLERFLKENKLKYKCVFDISAKPLKTILTAIDKTDVIIFQTQWVYEIAQTLNKHVRALKDKKIVIEHYIHEPTWFCKPDVVHDVYVLKTPGFLSEDDEDYPWKFHKLHKTKGIWEFKNKFDR